MTISTDHPVPELRARIVELAAERDALNRRVASQRFVLRTLDGLGRSLSAEEYRQARAAQPGDID